MEGWREIFLQQFSDIASTADEALTRDASALTQFRRLHHLDLPEGGLVLQPRSADEVSAIVTRARDQQVSVIARGGGSGVVQGVYPDPRSVVLDLSQLNRIGPLDRVNGHIEVDAGVNAEVLEHTLAAQGFTLGHWPQSIARASLGGLVATKSIGQYSTRYGGIEDMVRGLDVVAGTGEILTLGGPAPRRSAGPELLPLFIGSEGTLGIITRVRLRVWPTPPREEALAVLVPHFAAGLNLMRDWMQKGLLPSVLRLYDGAEAARTFASVRGQAVLIAVFHGLQSLVRASVEEAAQAADDQGAARAPSDLVQHWFDTRNDVGAWIPLLAQGFLVDTIEVAGAWTVLAPLYQAVTERVAQIAGIIGLTGHASHAYSDGANLYFTFLAKPETPDDGPRLYRDIWTAVMEATLTHHATVSHHHGVGRIRPEWVARERESELTLLHPIRDQFDPDGIMNRGALWM